MAAVRSRNRMRPCVFIKFPCFSVNFRLLSDLNASGDWSQTAAAVATPRLANPVFDDDDDDDDSNLKISLVY